MFNFTGGHGVNVEIPDEIVKKIEAEGDFEEFIDEETGYTCRINRLRFMDSLTGYVRLPSLHPLNSTLSYDDIKVDVHGGITFMGHIEEGMNQPPDPIHTWIGFDCNHAWDYNPRMGLYLSHTERDVQEVYRDWEYVKNELHGLCKQLKDLEGC